MTPDGAPVHLMNPAGEPIDFRHDLYDVAFLIFALAHAGGALERPDCLAAAEKVFTWAETNWTRPEGGFNEGAITPCPPYRQNPHMHMLEAALALHEASGEAKNLQRANKIAALMRDKLFSRTYGALPEYFDVNWSPLPGEEGRITEPGHQFEWSWLLDRWRRAGGGDLSDIGEALRIQGEVYGVDEHGIVFDEVWANGAARTRSSRLWPHTERIKAHAARYKRRRDPHAGRAIVQAYGVLMRYCDTPTPGVWRDRLGADGRFIEEPAPASSLYHITLGLAELSALAETL
jgi:mannose-6-phosphate isomerase